MRKSDLGFKFICLLSTLICSAVLTLSLPTRGQNPFSEIPLNSWIYASLAELGSAEFFQTPNLSMPQAGEPVLRIEAAFLLDNIVRELAAKSSHTVQMPISDLDTAALSSFVMAVAKDASPGVISSLLSLIKEFQSELGILANSARAGGEVGNSNGVGIIGSESVTIKSQQPDLVFVDIDAIAPVEQPVASKKGLVSAGQLSSLARQHFRELGLTQVVPKPPVQIPDDIELYAPLEIVRPQVMIGQEQSSAEIIAAANLSGWQRYQPSLFSQEGLLNQDPSTLYFLGVEANVLSGLTLGTLWIADQKLDSNLSPLEDERQVYKTLSGKLRLRPDFTLVGEYSQSTFSDMADKEASNDDVAARIGAIFHLGEVEFGADLRGVGSSFNPLLEESEFIPNSSGYGLSIKYRNLTVETMHDKVQPAAIDEVSENRTTLQLNYSFAERALFKAGYSFVDIDTVDPLQTELRERGESATFGLGVNLNNNTKLEADLTLGWQTDQNSATLYDTKKASAGIQWRLPWEADLKLKADYEFSDASDKNISTMVGLNYDFRENGSLLLGYQLINFGSESVEGETRAGAELSVSF